MFKALNLLLGILLFIKQGVLLDKLSRIQLSCHVVRREESGDVWCIFIGGDTPVQSQSFNC